jgi:hypothetical protein
MESGRLKIIGPISSIVIGPSAVVQIRPGQPVLVVPGSALLIQPKRGETTLIQPKQPLSVIPPQRGAWDERGWTKQTAAGQENYEGYFLAGARKFRGRITSSDRGRNISIYIHDPPHEIKEHPRGGCFQLVSDGWFRLHWSRPARNVDDAILYMEKVLDESLHDS